MRTQIDLERTPDSAAQARRALSDVADHLTPRRLEDARLLVSELVTNAVMHAATELDLTVLLRGDRLSVAVGDHDRRPLAPRVEVATTDVHGRGSLLLDALAESWGQLPRLDGKVVWAIL